MIWCIRSKFVLVEVMGARWTHRPTICLKVEISGDLRVRNIEIGNFRATFGSRLGIPVLSTLGSSPEWFVQRCARSLWQAMVQEIFVFTQLHVPLHPFWHEHLVEPVTVHPDAWRKAVVIGTRVVT